MAAWKWDSANSNTSVVSCVAKSWCSRASASETLGSFALELALGLGEHGAVGLEFTLQLLDLALGLGEGGLDSSEFCVG